MRTLISTLLLLTLLSVAALAQEAPPEPSAAPDGAAQEAVGDDAEATVPGEAAPAAEEGAAAEAPAAEAEAPSGPVGEMHMADGSIIEILSLQKLGKFYLYISGKLDGRTSTVLSPTRLADIQLWTGIAFQDQQALTIVTKDEKQYHFTDAHLYLGSDDPASYSFMGTDPNTYQESLITVKKADVKAIAFK